MKQLMNLESIYDTLKDNAKLVLGANAIGTFGPRMPEDKDYLEESLFLENIASSYKVGVDVKGEQTYKKRHFIHFGEVEQVEEPQKTLEESTTIGVAMLYLAHGGVLQHENYSESLDLDRWKTVPEFDALLPRKEVSTFFDRLVQNVDTRNPQTDADLVAVDAYVSNAMQLSELRVLYDALAINSRFFESAKGGVWGGDPTGETIQKFEEAGIFSRSNSSDEGGWYFKSSHDFRKLLPGEDPTFETVSPRTRGVEQDTRAVIFKRMAANVGNRDPKKDQDLIAIDHYVMSNLKMI